MKAGPCHAISLPATPTPRLSTHSGPRALFSRGAAGSGALQLGSPICSALHLLPASCFLALCYTRPTWPGRLPWAPSTECACAGGSRITLLLPQPCPALPPPPRSHCLTPAHHTPCHPSPRPTANAPGSEALLVPLLVAASRCLTPGTWLGCDLSAAGSLARGLVLSVVTPRGDGTLNGWALSFGCPRSVPAKGSHHEPAGQVPPCSLAFCLPVNPSSPTHTGHHAVSHVTLPREPSPGPSKCEHHALEIPKH